METAPLTQAHAAARSASSRSTSQAAPPASEQHSRAAEHFASAAEGIEDLEALRILKLLEQQHRQLALIVSSNGKPAQPTLSEESKARETAVDKPEAKDKASTTSGTTTATQSSSPNLPRKLARESSSSIASNLASARGIPQSRRRGPDTEPGHPTTSSVAQQKERHATKPGPLQQGSARKLEAKKSDGAQATTPQPTAQDEGFQKFYSSWQGLKSKLSAPLAFAGLPLSSEDGQSNAAEPVTTRSSPRTMSRATTTNAPDVRALFSRAALRAAEDGAPGIGDVHESFMVVPASGGTVSYANMLRAEREARRSSEIATDHDDEQRYEHFVDASESPQSRSPKASRRLPARGTKTGKTSEELEMENETLKKLVDNLSQRVYMWEKSAQSQTQAMQQSVRQLKPPPALSDGGLGSANEERVRELEEQVKAVTKELERFGRENEKLKTVVARYRERWEKLKEGARVRREGGERTPELAAKIVN